MSNTYFEHMNLHKYTRVARAQNGVEVKSMIDLMHGTGELLHYLQDLRGERGMGRCLSGHHVVLCKVTLLGKWTKSREIVNRAWRIRSEKLRKHQYKEDYVRSLEGKGAEWDGEKCGENGE